MMGEELPIRLVRSRRKTLAIEVYPGREVVVRAPARLPLRDIREFVIRREAWIRKHWDKPRADKPVEYTEQQEMALRAAARDMLPGLVARYAGLLGVSPARLNITGARTRFGSCSSKGGIAFSFRLMAYPVAAIEYVVLHELALLKQLNHSSAFYSILQQHMPDYRQRAALLKQRPVPPRQGG